MPTSGPGDKEVVSLEESAEAATQIFDQISAAYLSKYHSRNEEVARKFAEELVKTKYSELVAAITGLVPWVAGKMSRCDLPSEHHAFAGSEYEVVEFPGCPLLRHQQQKCEEVWEELALARRSSDPGLARDALCAAMAAISSRAEQTWLDSVALELEWRKKEDGQPRWRRRAIFEEVVQEALAQGARGHFVNYLLHPASTYRVAFAHKDGSLIPASLLLTFSVPMCKALRLMDAGGPLRRKPASWRRWPHFALQDLLPEEPEEDGTRYERVPAKGLQLEKAIRDMIRSPAHVIMLDSYAALAPRAECRNQERHFYVSELPARAKGSERFRVCVWRLGGDDPETLARKVYLRPPFTNYGLRIGHLRWRETVDGQWAREKSNQARILIGLQLP